MPAPKKEERSEDVLMVYFKNILNESERGKILLLAAKIDELLLELLESFFKGHRKKQDDSKLFGSMGPLGSFASRIEMAYRVGLISKTTADCFDILRKIRNDCAHGLQPFSLASGETAENFEQFKTMSYAMAGKGKLFELFKRFGLVQSPSTKELVFVTLTLNHMLLLQATLNKVRKVADNFPKMEDDNILPSDLSKILKKPN